MEQPCSLNKLPPALVTTSSPERAASVKYITSASRGPRHSVRLPCKPWSTRSPASQSERPGPHRGGGATDTRRGYMFALPALGVATMRRIAVEHLLNPLRINFDLDATSFELEQRG